MLPGPILIYECSNCKNHLKQQSFLTGNTFGAETYSDGKIIAPMLPNIPILTKCNKCNSLLWIDSLEVLSTIEWDDFDNTSSHSADPVEFLSIEDLLRALEESIAKTVKDEMYVRRLIW